jgi:uncharacterized protein (TIGR03083 family)
LPPGAIERRRGGVGNRAAPWIGKRQNVAMEIDEYHRWIEVESAVFTDLIRRDDLARAVPGCPGWSLGKLSVHVGGIQRWARGQIVGQRESEPTPDPLVSRDLVEWFVAGTQGLLAALHAADPDAPCSTLAPPERTSFWSRRQAHEIAVHRWDAQSAFGPPEPIDPVLAADGVAEIAEMFFPRQVRLGRATASPARLGLELDGARCVVIGTDGTDPIQRPDVVIAGPAEAVLLLLWKRTDLDDPHLTVHGSPDTARRLLAASITP